MSEGVRRGSSCTVTGRKLFVDPAFHGGGFHQGGDGSFLDTHVDFNIHPKHDDWLRVLNLLLYMNKDWPAYYFIGALLIRTDPKNEPRAILPLFNRAVFMLTSDNTFHGYRKMSLPPGRSRKSIAGYAYEMIEVGSPQAAHDLVVPRGGRRRQEDARQALDGPGGRQEEGDRQLTRVSRRPGRAARLRTRMARGA